MSVIIINGKQIVTNGKGNVVISNNEVFIDGKLVSDKTDKKEINIQVTGDIESLHIDYCNSVKVDGVAKDVTTTSGDITVNNNVGGDVRTTYGDVASKSINGNVSTTSGDVQANTITGSVRTVSGNIKNGNKL